MLHECMLHGLRLRHGCCTADCSGSTGQGEVGICGGSCTANYAVAGPVGGCVRGKYVARSRLAYSLPRWEGRGPPSPRQLARDPVSQASSSRIGKLRWRVLRVGSSIVPVESLWP
jgi:hypothetical protein